MSLAEKQIVALIDQAGSQGERRALERAMDLIRTFKKNSVVLDTSNRTVVSDDVWLFACEAAIYIKEWDTAKECLDVMQHMSFSRKAFTVRSLFCFASFHLNLAAGLRCSALIERLQVAIIKVVKGVQLALQDPARLSHLVVHGFHLHWNIVRGLYREGTYAEILTSVTAMAAALEKIDYKNWTARVTSQLRVAVCQLGCGRAAEANATLTKAAEQAQRTTPHMKLPILRMQVAFSKITANPKLRQDAVKSYLRAILAVQNVYAGITEGQAAITELMASYTELGNEVLILADGAKAPKAADVPVAPAKGGAKGGGGSSKNQDEVNNAEEVMLKEELFAEVGCLLAFLGSVDAAKEVARRAPHGGSLRCRVFGEYVRAVLQFHTCGGVALQSEGYFNPCTPQMIEEMSSGLKKLEKALGSAIRLPDVLDRIQVVHIGIVLMWRLSQPLLQPTTREHISKPFQTALRMLDDLGSNMHMLRALLALEVAFCDQDQYVVKAASKVNYALSMDYAPSEEAVSTYGFERPLDRLLTPLHHRFTLKLDIYGLPNNTEDEVLLLLEQAKEGNAMTRTSLLNRAVVMLQETEPPEEYFVDNDPIAAANAAAPTNEKDKKGAKAKADAEKKDAEAVARDPEMEARRMHLRSRASLYEVILQLGWRDQSVASIPVVRSAISEIIKRKWVRRADRDMQHLKIKAYNALAETYLRELESKNLKLGQRSFEEPNDDDDDDMEDDLIEMEGATDGGSVDAKKRGPAGTTNVLLARAIAEKTRAVEEAQAIVSECLCEVAALSVALVTQLKCEDRWAVLNAGVNVWNWYRHLFHLHNDYIAATVPLEIVYNAILQCSATVPRDMDVVSRVAYALVRALLQKFVASKMTNLNEAEVVHQDLNKIKCPPDATSPILKQCNEICEKMLQLLPNPMDGKHFYTLLALIRRFEGKPVDYRTNVQGKALQQLQASLSLDGKDCETLLAQAAETVALNPNVELIARVAHCMKEFPSLDKATVKLCSVGQQLYDKGALGCKDNPTQPAAPVKEKGTGKGAAASTVTAPTPTLGLEGSVSNPIVAPSAEDWFFFCRLLMCKAECLHRFIDPSTHAKDTQNELRKTCLETVRLAAKAAIRGRPDSITSNVLLCMHTFLSVVGEFSLSSFGRSIVFAPLSDILSPSIVRAINTQDFHMPSHAIVAARLFSLLLSCLRDRGEFEKGTGVLKLAFGALPLTHHNLLWESDIEFKCASGKNPAASLAKVKEYGPATQAKAWGTFSRCSAEKKDQLFGLVKAVEVLEGQPGLQAEYLQCMASWLARNGGSIEDIQDAALTAVDVLAPFVDVVPEDFFDGTMSRKSSMRRSSRAGSTAGGTTVRSASVGGSSRDRKSDRDSSSKNKSNDSLTTMLNITTMVRAHVLLALTHVGHEDRRSSLLMAYGYVMRMWGMITASVNSYMRRLRTKLNQAGDSSVRGKVQIVLGPGVTTNLEELSRADLTAFAIPSYPAAWLAFVMPPHVIEHLPQVRATFSLNMISNPSTFNGVLLTLSHALVEEGLDLLAVPVNTLCSTVARVCMIGKESSDASKSTPALVEGRAIVAVALSRNAKIATDAQNPALGQIIMGALKLGPSDSEKASLREDARMSSGAAKRTVEDEAADEACNPQDVRVSTTTSLTDLWMEQAHWLRDMGEVSAARLLLTDIQFLSQTYGESRERQAYELMWCDVLRTEGKALPESLISCAGKVSAGMPVGHYVAVMLQKFRKALDELDMPRCLDIYDQAQRTLLKQCNLAENPSLAPLIEANTSRLLVQLFITLASLVLRKLTDMPFVERYCPVEKWIGAWTEQLQSIKEMGIPARCGELVMARLTFVHWRLCHLRRTCRVRHTDAGTASIKGLVYDEMCVLKMSYEFYLAAITTAAALQHGPREVDSVALMCRAQRELADVSAALGFMYLRNASVNMCVVLEEWTSALYQKVDFPQVDGLDAAVVKRFMSNTTRERRAAQRYIAYQKGHKDRQARREEIRAEWEVRKKQHEEALAAAAAAAPKGKDAKRKKSVDQNTGPVPLAPDCGIPSPNLSETESDEDSQDDDDQSFASIVHSVCPDEPHRDVLGSHVEALACFNAALHSTPPNSYAYYCAALGVAAAQRLALEHKIVFTEEWRNHVREGNRRKTWVEELWTRPVELPAVVEEEAPAKGKKGKDDGKKGGSKDGVVQPQPPATPSEPRRTLTVGMNEQQDHAMLALANLEEALDQFNAAGDLSLLEHCAMELMHAYIMAGQRVQASRALSIAASARCASFVLSLWGAAAHADTRDLCLHRLMTELGTSGNGLSGMPMFRALQRALTTAGATHKRVLLNRGLNPNNDVFFGNQPIAQDVMYLVLHCDAEHRQLYSTLMRNGVVPDLRRCALNAKAVTSIRSYIKKADVDLRQVFASFAGDVDESTDPTLDDKINEISEVYESSIRDNLKNLLDPILLELAPLFEKLSATRPTLVLCLDPLLLDVPVELHPVLCSPHFRAVTREISLYTAANKMNHIKQTNERVSAAQLGYCVDLNNESRSKIFRALAAAGGVDLSKAPPAKDGAKLPFTNGVSGSPTDGSASAAAVRPSTSQVHRLLSSPSTVQGFLYCGLGRLGGCIDIAGLAGLNLEHLKCAYLLDNAVNELSTRRESLQDVAKSSHKTWLERNPRVAMLFLARGAGAVVSQSLAVRPSLNDALLKMLATPTGGFLKNSPELVHLHVRLRGAVIEASGAAPAATSTPSVVDTFGLWKLNFLEQMSVISWGIMAEDVVPAPGKK